MAREAPDASRRAPISGETPRAVIRRPAGDANTLLAFAALRRANVLADVAEPALRTLALRASLVKVQRGAVVVARGDKADALFVVHTGRFKVTTADPHGHQITLNVLSKGELFGEVAFFDGAGRSADVTAMSSGSLVTLDRASFFEVFSESSSVGLHLMSAMSRRLRRLTERMEDRAFLDVEKRLAKRLVEAAEDVGATREGFLMPGISVALSQQDLGELVDASRERVNRQLALWARDGILTVRRRCIQIDDPDALRRVYRGPEK